MTLKPVQPLVYDGSADSKAFYAEEVTADPYSWRLCEFFRQLFNFCFPVNYHNLQSDKIALANGTTV